MAALYLMRKLMTGYHIYTVFNTFEFLTIEVDIGMPLIC